MDLPSNILQLAEAGCLDRTSLLRWCEQTGLSAVDASDSLAKQVGLAYLAGELHHDVGDLVMNALMNAVTSPEFLAVSNSAVPKLTLDVYLAFDAGEYFRPNDQTDENPAAKYTRPMLQSLLRAAEAAGAGVDHNRTLANVSSGVTR